MKDIKEYNFFNQLKALPFIEQIWLFGSRARGDNKERSDFDLAIVCPKAKAEDWRKIINIIENADTLLKIDYIRFDELNEQEKIKTNITKFKKILYSKEDTAMHQIHWQDYFYNLGNALNKLEAILKHKDINTFDYMRDAAIQRFEFVTELYWKILKKILAYEKIDSNTPRDVLQKAFQFQLIDDEEIWLSMLDDRNTTSHVYIEEVAQKVFDNLQLYFPVFKKTYEALKARYGL